MDVFYRIKALAESGVKIHLHCFEYKRPKAPELEKHCASVSYYKRPQNPRKLFGNTPYIVGSRKNTALLANLVKDDYPILFEGLHTCGWLDAPELKGRFKLVRTHNIEHDYYHQLALSEKNPLKATYFTSEARKLERFEPVLKVADTILAISQKDAEHFEKYGNRVECFTPFHPEPVTDFSEPAGKYGFYHGNLEVGENQQALKYLITEVFNEIDTPLVIAGKGAQKAVQSLPESPAQVTVYDSPSETELQALAQNAAFHILPTFQATGFKLKLMYSLYTGRRIIANDVMVAGTGLGKFCTLANSPAEMQEAMLDASKQPFDGKDYRARIQFIEENYYNASQAARIIEVVENL
jgi:hypothetical protein